MTESLAQVRVRFAPSPTGHLHVGGARTALFNFLFARNHNGKFLLRIEDTDRERSEESFVSEINQSLQWLGFNWDEDPIYQSKRMEIYLNTASELIATNNAYHCFCEPAELDEKRKTAQQIKKQYKYDRKCRSLKKAEVENRLKNDDKFAIRFAVPNEGETVVHDLVYGVVQFNNNEIDDFIIVRRDKTPTYQLAVVADDKDMKISHVIRGDDHLSNTPKQLLIFKALAVKPPLYAHLPLIMGQDGKRLSKRHGAVSVAEFQNEGIFPEALLNHLALLGWSPKDDTEFMAIDELISRFKINDVSKRSAIFDYKKLIWMNGQHLSSKSAEELLPIVSADWGITPDTELDDVYLKKVLELVKARAKTREELINFGKYFFEDPDSYDEKGRNKHWNDSSVTSNVQQLVKNLEKLNSFGEEKIEKVLRSTAETLGIKAAELIHPVRLALTGFSVSPSLFEIMELLGKEISVRRIKSALNRLPRVIPMGSR
ncbi:glutamate--tRNA ligase [Candidatus Marinimicrobia bacterium MT.SAG.4]|nr:glutamate--tRNA ligase [Candidatus Marinimicrobia bacterium MT.SAG.4]